MIQQGSHHQESGVSPLCLTLAEYDQMVATGAFVGFDRKIELIYGELTQIDPAGPVHDDLIVFLTNWSARHTDPEQTLVASQIGLDLESQHSRPEPDLMWIRNRRYRQQHPQACDVQLAIEVSDSSLTHDLEVKRRLYAAAEVVEYWIVDAGAKCIHVHSDPQQGNYHSQRIVILGDTLAPRFRPQAELKLDELF